MDNRRQSKSPIPADNGGAVHGAYDKVVTAVRARPFNVNDGPRAADIIRYGGKEQNSIGIVDPTNQDAGAERMFQFDHTFWSVDKSRPDFYSGQRDVFEAVGLPIVEASLKGVNCSLFAYGQTGSGKTYTMMGGDPSSEDAGVIPRLCRSLLERLELDRSGTGSSCGGEVINSTEVCIAYVEIYNEKVFDLLSHAPDTACRVREHPETGAYIENLTKANVVTYTDVDRVLREGGGRRHVAATLMNSESSRSHAAFIIFISQHLTPPDENSNEDITRKSKVSLVDLAGSERMSTTGASGDRLREASNINRSLSVLGDVIKALSEKSRLGNSSKNHEFVPYRNSILTWLLKDSLGGNSRTTMLATISPTDSSYNESINTLRYIERTKLIVNNVSANVTRSENVRINNLLKQISDLEMKYAELQSHQIDREQHHRDDMEKMQAEFEVQFTEQLKILAGELEMHYEQKLQAKSSEILAKRGLSFAEALSFDGGGDSASAAVLSPVKEDVDIDIFSDRSELVEKYAAIIEEKDQIIANYEKVISTSKADEDNMVSSLKYMISTLKEKLEAANSRYDTMSDRYRDFSEVVDIERKEMAQLNVNCHALTVEITRLKLECAKKDRELQERVKDNALVRDEVERLRDSYGDSQKEHNQTVLTLEGYIQDLTDQKSQVAELESQLDIERYSNTLKSAMVQDLHVQLAFEQTSKNAKVNALTQSLDLQSVQIQELTRDYEDRLVDMQHVIDQSRQEVLNLQTINDNNMLNLQEVLETARNEHKKVVLEKNDEILKLSEKLTDLVEQHTDVQDQYNTFISATDAQWEPILLCLQTLANQTKNLKKCLKTNKIDDIIPFLEETRQCYKGGNISNEKHRDETTDQLSIVYSCFRDIVMAWMKNTVGADKDYDYKDLAEALVLAKVEIAQNHYELENLQYLLKCGEKDKSRGIAAVWGSIGSRGRSFLFESNNAANGALKEGDNSGDIDGLVDINSGETDCGENYNISDISKNENIEISAKPTATSLPKKTWSIWSSTKQNS